MKITFLFFLILSFNLLAQETQTRAKCPPGTKLSTIAGDEPLCRIGWYLVQVPGFNLPAGMGCFKCEKKNTPVSVLNPKE